jgi:hypothetical protein
MRAFYQQSRHRSPIVPKPSQETERAGRPAHPVLRLQQNLGNQAVLRWLRNGTGRAVGSIQRFDEGEHKAIGDVASGGQTIFLAPGMPVTYGEVVSLAGDYFGDWQTLYRLAGKPGITEGTRGEVWYAVLVKIRTNAEGTDEKQAEAGGLGKFFDEKAKAAVKARFLSLAAHNIAHFPNPKKGDAGRTQEEKSTDFKTMGAGASYRANHATALTLAAAVGQAHAHKTMKAQSHAPGTVHGPDTLNDALMLEAFGDHFLTDSFSAGHQQTERASVQEYWNSKVPDFWGKFQGWLADAIVLQARKTGVAPRGVTPQFERELSVLPNLLKAMSKLPKLGFGDVVSDVIHDYFNKNGTEVEVAGRQITLVGDKHLLTAAVPNSSLPAKKREFQPKDDQLRHVTDKSKDTFDAAAAAVSAGIAEVYHAAELGQQGEDPQMVPEKILNAGGGTFAAEKLLPKLKPDTVVKDPRLKALNWERASAEDLFSDSRMVEGFVMSMEKYAGMVSDALSDLSKEQIGLVNVALTWRMLGGKKTVIPLLRDILKHTTPISGGGFDPDMIRDINDLRANPH